MSGKSNRNQSEKDRSEVNIAKDGIQQFNQQKRLQRMRRYNNMLLASIVILIVLCVSLLAKIYELNKTISGLNGQIGSLSRYVKEQQETVDALRGELQAAREEGAAQNEESLSTVGEGQQDVPEDGEEAEVPGEVEAAHKVYLTFDDGPSIYTQDILDILEEYGVKATFFVVGKETDSAKESMKKIVEAGHTLGMHSYSHKYSELYASVENFAEDFAKQQQYIYDVTGVKSTIYRFPGGSSNTVSKLDMKLFGEYLHSQGAVFFDWNVASGDGGSAVLSVETLLENSTSTISRYSSSVILMHDSAGKKTTVEALPEIIETILAMEDTVILPITESTKPVQHRHWDFDVQEDPAED